MSNLKQSFIVIKIVIAVLLEINSGIHETPSYLQNPTIVGFLLLIA
jgi:hypothetical protein